MPEKSIVPNTLDDRIRQAKIAFHSCRRIAAWAMRPSDWPSPRTASQASCAYLLGRWSWPLTARIHPVFDAGKRHNLALALPSFHGLELHPDRVFSFWKTLGRVTAGNGYRAGMALSGGCLVPAVGGGVCLITNLLFEAAVRLGWEIVERYGHTMEAVVDHRTPWGLDATVFWPYVDLRFRSTTLCRLEFDLTVSELILSVFSQEPSQVRSVLFGEQDETLQLESGTFRTNSIRRRRLDAQERILGEEIVAVNRKKLVPTTSLTRNCMTCNELQCGARERHLKSLGAS